MSNSVNGRGSSRGSQRRQPQNPSLADRFREFPWLPPDVDVVARMNVRLATESGRKLYANRRNAGFGHGQCGPGLSEVCAARPCGRKRRMRAGVHLLQLEKAACPERMTKPEAGRSFLIGTSDLTTDSVTKIGKYFERSRRWSVVAFGCVILRWRPQKHLGVKSKTAGRRYCRSLEGWLEVCIY
jgi:hypothetical protein